MEERRIAEICCGSFYDAKQAALGGAGRIELNSALALGGLTPGTATLRAVKRELAQLKVIAMVRPRGAGFCYGPEEFMIMKEECRELLSEGADGIAFGILQEDASLDEERTRQLVELIHREGGEAVFHRAFDCTGTPEETLERLIGLGVDRVLTSGGRASAPEGRETLRRLKERAAGRIGLLAGSGVNGENAGTLMAETGICQLHSSCKAWKTDPTTERGDVSYRMAEGERRLSYDVVDAALVRAFVEAVEGSRAKQREA